MRNLSRARAVLVREEADGDRTIREITLFQRGDSRFTLATTTHTDRAPGKAGLSDRDINGSRAEMMAAFDAAAAASLSDGFEYAS